MKDYKLDIGNSSTGQIGLVAYCSAKNKREALAYFKNEFGETIELQTGTYYQNVYLNWKAIKLSDITEDWAQP